jgi:hypothetical protein
LSKAALRSTPTTATTFAFALAETKAAWAVLFLNLCCDVGRMSFDFMKASRSSLALSTLERAHRMATGLYDGVSVLTFPPSL